MDNIAVNFRRIYAIPDIHGRRDLLDLALEILDSDGYNFKQDLLIFLGDMIDRGPDSRGVIDLIMRLQSDHPGTVIALRGNHEDFAVDHYVRGKDKCLWIWNGGQKTLDSYENKQMSTEHVKWLASLPYHYETQGFYFSHAPIPRDQARTRPIERLNPNEPARAGSEYNVWERTWYYFGVEGEQRGGLMDVHEGPRSSNGTGNDHLVGVCGHIHRGSLTKDIRKFNKYLMLDCGCGCFPGSPLAVHECLSGKTLYADPSKLIENKEAA